MFIKKADSQTPLLKSGSSNLHQIWGEQLHKR